MITRNKTPFRKAVHHWQSSRRNGQPMYDHTYLKNHAMKLTERQWSFSGVSTFAHLKHIRCLTTPYEPFDIGIIGVPFDTAVTYRPGTPPLGLMQCLFLSPLVSVASFFNSPVCHASKSPTGQTSLPAELEFSALPTHTYSPSQEHASAPAPSAPPPRARSPTAASTHVPA